MTWQEFEKNYIEEGGDKAQLEELQEVHWDTIGKVYEFHPALSYSSTLAKKQIARLIVQVGIGVIYAMQKDAQIAQQRDERRIALRAAVERCKKEIENAEEELRKLDDEECKTMKLWNLKKDGDKQ